MLMAEIIGRILSFCNAISRARQRKPTKQVTLSWAAIVQAFATSLFAAALTGMSPAAASHLYKVTGNDFVAYNVYKIASSADIVAFVDGTTATGIAQGGFEQPNFYIRFKSATDLVFNRFIPIKSGDQLQGWRLLVDSRNILMVLYGVNTDTAIDIHLAALNKMGKLLFDKTIVYQTSANTWSIVQNADGNYEISYNGLFSEPPYQNHPVLGDEVRGLVVGPDGTVVAPVGIFSPLADKSVAGVIGGTVYMTDDSTGMGAPSFGKLAGGYPLLAWRHQKKDLSFNMAMRTMKGGLATSPPPIYLQLPAVLNVPQMNVIPYGTILCGSTAYIATVLSTSQNVLIGYDLTGKLLTDPLYLGVTSGGYTSNIVKLSATRYMDVSSTSGGVSYSVFDCSTRTVVDTYTIPNGLFTAGYGETGVVALADGSVRINAIETYYDGGGNRITRDRIFTLTKQ